MLFRINYRKYYTGLMLACLTACGQMPATKAIPDSETWAVSLGLLGQDNGDCWNELALGELPAYNAYDAFDSVLRRYDKLCYRRTAHYGCEPDPAAMKRKAVLELDNQAYFLKMETIYGSGWKKRFDAEVEELQQYLWENGQHIEAGGIVCNDLSSAEHITETCLYKGRNLQQTWLACRDNSRLSECMRLLSPEPPDHSYSSQADTKRTDGPAIAVHYEVIHSRKIRVTVYQEEEIICLGFEEGPNGTSVSAKHDQEKRLQ